MKVTLRTAGIGFILLSILAVAPAAFGDMPPPYNLQPYDTDASGTSASSHFGSFTRQGFAQDLRYYLGSGASLQMEFALAFTDGTGNDFGILTSADNWNAYGGTSLARFDFFLDGNLQGSFTALLLPDTVVEFDLPGEGLVANRILLTNLGNAGSTMTFDNAGVAYVVPEPCTVTLACLGMASLLCFARFRSRRRGTETK